MLLTAGLAAGHDWDDVYGIDLDDVGAEHSLNLDPTLIERRAAAQLLGEDLWVAVRLPAEYEGEAEPEDGQVIRQWMTVALAAEDLTWLREALQLNNSDDLEGDEDEDLDPLH